MKITFTATVQKFNKQKYKKAVDAAVKKCFMEAGRKFLGAAVPRIPVWTGMLRGAFRNAEDLFGRVQGVGTNQRVRTNLKGTNVNTTTRRAWYYPPGGGKVLRTPEAGRQFSTVSSNILEITGAKLATGNMSYYFRFEVNITYFDLLDEKRNWNAWKLGSAALEAYVKANLELPNPLEFMTRTIIKSS